MTSRRFGRQPPDQDREHLAVAADEVAQPDAAGHRQLVNGVAAPVGHGQVGVKARLRGGHRRHVVAQGRTRRRRQQRHQRQREPGQTAVPAAVNAPIVASHPERL